jgi:hypothetical protein
MTGMSGQPDPVEALHLLRAILKAIENGEITIKTRTEQRVVRQLRGAVVALEALIAGRDQQTGPTRGSSTSAASPTEASTDLSCPPKSMEVIS